MARFLERVLIRKEHVARSPRRISARRARPALERLEERCNPIIAILIGHPAAIVQVNPQPLPPIVMVDFQLLNLPLWDSAPVQVTNAHFDLQGRFSQTGEWSAAAGAAPTHWSLEVMYSLAGKYSESSHPPDPAMPATIAASYQMSGAVRLILTIDQPVGKTEVVAESSIMQYLGTAQGTGQGARPQESVSFNFTAIATKDIAQTSGKGPSRSFLVLKDWTENSTDIVFCKYCGTGAPAILGSFTRQAQIYESVTPANPPGTGAPQNAATLIDSVFNDAGTFQTAVQPSGLLPGVCLLNGQTLSMGQLEETITLPSTVGSTPTTEMISELFAEHSNFQSLFIELDS
ncbi:MAG TPA: hypothetical protein VK395_11000 [Gemmataceae bacterium]|nr:hypothetical protein [Gemmataceae bacterium]